MAIFTGAGVAIVTPMHENGDVNYEKLSEILEEQIAGGTDAIIICGTTGESSTLTHEEHLDVIRYTVEKVAKRIPVIAGTGSNCTATAIYLSQEAEKAGADALLLVTPYYNKATQNGLIAHYTAIAESVKLPIVLYNVPSRTGCNIQPQTAMHNDFYHCFFLALHSCKNNAYESLRYIVTLACQSYYVTERFVGIILT